MTEDEEAARHGERLLSEIEQRLRKLRMRRDKGKCPGVDGAENPGGTSGDSDGAPREASPLRPIKKLARMA